VSFRVSVDLGHGKRGEAKRSILLEAIEFIEFSFEENEKQLLKQEGIQFNGKKVIAANIEDSLDKMLWGPSD
jgi:hypothetical protein